MNLAKNLERCVMYRMRCYGFREGEAYYFGLCVCAFVYIRKVENPFGWNGAWFGKTQAIGVVRYGIGMGRVLRNEIVPSHYSIRVG